jgi:hypothetical protein
MLNVHATSFYIKDLSTVDFCIHWSPGTNSLHIPRNDCVRIIDYVVVSQSIKDLMQ